MDMIRCFCVMKCPSACGECHVYKERGSYYVKACVCLCGKLLFIQLIPNYVLYVGLCTKSDSKLQYQLSEDALVLVTDSNVVPCVFHALF